MFYAIRSFKKKNRITISKTDILNIFKIIWFFFLVISSVFPVHIVVAIVVVIVVVILSHMKLIQTDHSVRKQ